MYGPTELIKIGADPSRFKKYGANEYHGPCPLCGGRDRFIVWTDREFPSWRWFCRQCTPDGGWLDEINPNLKEPMTPEELNERRLKDLERRVEEMERRQEKQERAIKELRDEQAWLRYYDARGEKGRRIWEQRGVPDDYQNLWLLGYCEDFSVRTSYNDWYSTPSISIPIYGYDWQVNNIKHRLLKPPNSGGKYRQEKTGVPAVPFISIAGQDHGPLFVAEGEIKAMVTYVTLGNDDIQVSGLPSGTPGEDLLQVFENHEPIYLCLDPDIDPSKTANILGKERTRIISLPMKIDDAILADALDGDGIKRLMRMAR